MSSDRGAVLPATMALMMLVAVVFGVGLIGAENAARGVTGPGSVQATISAEEAVIGALRVAAHEMELIGATECSHLPDPVVAVVEVNGHSVEARCVEREGRVYLWAMVAGRGRQAEVVHTPAGLRLRHWGPPEVAVRAP